MENSHLKDKKANFFHLKVINKLCKIALLSVPRIWGKIFERLIDNSLFKNFIGNDLSLLTNLALNQVINL